MNPLRLAFFAVIFFMTTLLVLSFGDDYKYAGGSPAGYTGSPYDNKDCKQCHGGTVSNAEGYITSDIPAEGYLSGQTYTITVSVPGSGKKGFLVSPHDLQGNLLGTLIAGSGTKLVGSNKYITQSSSTTANPGVWTFQWTAPTEAVSEITFYGAFTAGKTVTKISNLQVFLNTTSIHEVNNLSASVYPNPVTGSEFYVQFCQNISGIVKIDLFDLQGRNLSSRNLVAAGDDYTVLITRDAAIQKGVYLLRIEKGKNISVQKLIFD